MFKGHTPGPNIEALENLHALWAHTHSKINSFDNFGHPWPCIPCATALHFNEPLKIRNCNDVKKCWLNCISKSISTEFWFPTWRNRLGWLRSIRMAKWNLPPFVQVSLDLDFPPSGRQPDIFHTDLMIWTAMLRRMYNLWHLRRWVASVSNQKRVDVTERRRGRQRSWDASRPYMQSYSLNPSDIKKLLLRDFENSSTSGSFYHPRSTRITSTKYPNFSPDFILSLP